MISILACKRKMISRQIVHPSTSLWCNLHFVGLQCRTLFKKKKGKRKVKEKNPTKPVVVIRLETVTSKMLILHTFA